MSGYYVDRLSAHRLRRVYEIAPPRIRQYLDAEVSHVLERIRPGDTVLELGCGYGRAIPRLASRAGLVIGIDTSPASLDLAQEMLGPISNCRLLNMDAVALAFRDHAFDLVVCIQNGISAFHVDPKHLIGESLRVTRPGGKVLLATYSDKFWEHRLKWFEIQSEAGLLGELDLARTGNGVIACKDGFTGRAFSRAQLLSLTTGFDAKTQILEIDESSLFCEILVR